MAEYIERMSAISTACKGCNKEFSNEPCEPSECYIQRGLFNIPASDVVEVVRCKDCVKAVRHEVFPWSRRCRVEDCRLSHKETHFCSYGERREGE